jgi:hypothetical protein
VTAPGRGVDEWVSIDEEGGENGVLDRKENANTTIYHNV